MGESLWPDLTQSRGTRSAPEVKNQGRLSRDLPFDIHIYLVSPTKTSGKIRVWHLWGGLPLPSPPKYPVFSKTAIQFSAKLGNLLHVSWGWVQSSQVHKMSLCIITKKETEPDCGSFHPCSLKFSCFHHVFRTGVKVAILLASSEPCP